VVKCCQAPSGYEELFSEKQARRDARSYRRKGLGGPARWIVDVVRGPGLAGATVLEPGGGVGAIQIELLKAGAARSTVVELSPGYEDVAADLAREAGVAERTERHVGDFAADGTEPADVVVLHRVVCCYPDYDRLLTAAATKARRKLVYTYPPRNVGSRAVIALLNIWPWLKRSEFRAFVHPPRAMEAIARRHGFEPYARRRRGIWRGVALERTDRGLR
jgi:Methyltransferase domain